MIKQLNNRFRLLCLCAGDFNEIIQSLEKKGGSTRSQSQMQLFRYVINECGFLDLGYKGSPYTWHKYFSNGHSLWERLDHGLATNDWLMKFLGMRLIHLSSNSSYHSPLWIFLDGLDVVTTTKPFRFDKDVVL